MCVYKIYLIDAQIQTNLYFSLTFIHYFKDILHCEFVAVCLCSGCYVVNTIHQCAGGLSTGLGVRECLVKECQEEASVELSDLEKLTPVGAVRYTMLPCSF